MRLILVPIISLLCITGNLFAQSVSFAKADSLFEILQKKSKAMGTVCISKNGKVIYSRSIGWAEALARKNNNDSTTFRIGSVTKMFTATMIFQLIEEQKLKETTLISEFFPEMVHLKGITIAQLLNHCSGLHNFTNDDAYQTYFQSMQTHDEMLQRIDASPSEFLSGSKHAYSNTNYVLLGYVIEQLTGSTYSEQVMKRIVKPLGLKHTYAGKSLGSFPNEARSYEYAGMQWQSAKETDMSIPHGAGMMVSSPKDLCLFIDQLMQGKVMSSASVKKMQTMEEDYGSGIFSFPFGNRIAWGHNGGIDAFSSMVAWFPDDSISVACTFNGLEMPMNDIVIGLLSIYYNYPYTLPEFKEIAVSFSKAELLQYPGTYSSPGFPLKIKIREERGKFYAQATGQGEFPLTPKNPTDFQFEPAGISIQFEKAVYDFPKQTFKLMQAGQMHVFEKELTE